ncbi:MAG: hypothetical protein M1833_005105 [Piccolia ochrophora]|nr:MAG: hypothetical protein M1833_005105 [Piccolia ochrophora]
MAATTLVTSPPPKRPLTVDAGSDRQRDPKRRRALVLHRHHARQKQHLPHHAYLEHFAAQGLLKRSVCVALDTAGFDAADPVALESFCANVDEYMTKVASTIRLSMLSSRRIRPIPQDFTYALAKEQLRLTDLTPYFRSRASPKPPFPPLPPPAQGEHVLPSLSILLDNDLGGAMGGKRDQPAPRHFPSLPSRHTYRATADYTTREHDPRRLRERATEESRLGEEALRRLVSASHGGKHDAPAGLRRSGKCSRRKERDDVWESALDALSKEVGESSLSGKDLGGIVNSERVYWRRDTFRNQRGSRVQKVGTPVVDVKMTNSTIV